MDDELLIEYVRQHEELYDPGHRLYCDNNHKEMIWKRIGLQLKRSGTECKNRWVSIRDQCRKVVTKKKILGEGSVRKWKYEDNLSFLLPFFKERKRKNNNAPVFEQMFLGDMTFSQIDTLDEANDADDLEDLEQQQTKKRRTEIILEPSSTVSSNSNVSYRVKNEDIIDFETSSMDEIKIAGINSRNNNKGLNPIDSFFDAMSATVKQFPPYFQVLAKSKIFSVVSELELKQLQSSNPTSSSSGIENPESPESE